METKLVTRRSFSAAPSIKVAPSHEVVTKGTDRTRRGSRVIFFDENGNEITDESKETCQEQNRKLSKEGRLGRGRSLLVRRRSSSLDAARFTAWYNTRRNSNLRRDQFLQSFGKTTIRYPNLNEGDIMESMAYLNVPTMESTAEPETPLTVDSYDLKRRTKSAGPVLVRPSSSMENAGATHENLLEIRGSEYYGNPRADLDLTAKIRQQSAKRRIRRMMEAEQEKAEQERLTVEEKKANEKKKRRTLRGATLAVMAMNVSASGFKSFAEKKKWLSEKRLRIKQIVSRSSATNCM